MLISEVYNEDCMIKMAQFPDNFWDLAICDPGYGIKDTWSKSRTDRFFHKGKLSKYQNESIPDLKYFEELFRISKNQIIWGGNYFTEFLRPTNAWIVWDKGRNADKTFMSEGEMAWTSFKKCLRIIKFQWDGAKKGNETGIIKIHPHQKPLDLYKWILRNYAKEENKIIDTHMGSQSSRIACYEGGYDFWGWEIDKDYFDAGCKRFDIFKAQQKLF